MIATMRARGRWLFVALTLLLWVLSGPIGMAFDNCAMMGAMCEAPCGLLSYMTVPAVADVAALQPVDYLPTWSTPSPTLVSAGPLTPPPKSSLLSA